MNPEIAVIGGVSLLLLFGLPLIKNKYVKRIPAPMVVVLVAVPLGLFFDLSHEHTYTFGGQSYQVGEKYLVDVPNNMFDALTLPSFSGLATLAGWKWVLMFALIGSLESLLSARAIDSIDPWRRKTDLNRDLLAVGVANTLSASVGGLPMISEIVRSKANIDNGARTRFADLFHGLFLLSFVALVPFLIHRIPLAALGAMLVYTGFRLASPREFAKVYKVGREQLLVFVTTIIAVLATDLLIGIAIGIGVEFLIALINYPPVRSLFVPAVSINESDENTYVVRVRYAAVFSNWLALRGRVVGLDHGRDVVLDLSETVIVDHTVMEKLHELEKEFEEKNRKLLVTGLEKHSKFSDHPHAGRTRT
jgi:MFS superfamily sulfate permease-like transporter